jgi:hypothetical protein
MEIVEIVSGNSEKGRSRKFQFWQFWKGGILEILDRLFSRTFA